MFCVVPTLSPVDVRMLREDPGTITVFWQPFTLVEARGFIEYIVKLYAVVTTKRQDPESIMQRVSMNQSNAVFTGIDLSIQITRHLWALYHPLIMQLDQVST